MTKWMQGAVKHKGALRATAKRAGILTKTHKKLTLADIEKLEKSSNPMTRKRATLAETFARSRRS